MPRGSAAADRRLGISDSVVEPKGFPIPNQLRSFNDALGSQKVETSYFVVIAEHTPVRMGGCSGLDRQLGILWNFAEI